MNTAGLTPIAPGGIWITRLSIAIVACVLTIILEWQRPEMLNRIDEGLRDIILQVSADQRPETRIAVIDINEDSLSTVGPWPWPRRKIADLVEILLSTYGARAVGLDIVFPDPGKDDGDQRLAVLAEHAPLCLAQIFDYTQRSPALAQGDLIGGSAVAPGLNVVPAFGYIANHGGLKDAKCVGNISYTSGANGVLRHTPVRTRYQSQDYLHFAATILRHTESRPPDTPQNPPTWMPQGNQNGLWRVPFSRALSAYTIIPASEIFQERAARSLIAGRLVLVGSSSLSLGDRVSTPLAPLSAGVMVHAASLTGLLDLAEGVARPAWSGQYWLIGWTLLSIGLSLFCIARLPAWGNSILLVGLALLWLAQAAYGVRQNAEWSISAPLFAYLVMLIVAIPYEWWQAQSQTRKLLNTFSHYVAQPVLDEIVRRGLTYSLKPTLCEVTVLIADMEGYTRTTTSLSLEDAAKLTKDFLDCLTRPVLSWQGTLDKYSGDGLVAFWGAPIPCKDHADRAVSAALDILQEVDRFNTQRAAQNLPPVRVRIGVESGRALVGDLGTPFRSTYTAVGDCINFASRLEAAARDLPTRLVIGAEATRQLAQHETISLGTIALRGTQTIIEVFTVSRLLQTVKENESARPTDSRPDTIA